MTDEVITDIGEHILPFGRRATLKDVEFESGLHMLRVTLREGRRFTIIDLDSASAATLGEVMCKWAGEHGDDA
jgi:hypothetical protein